MPALLDIKEAAAFLRVSETSLRRWTNAGRLPCLRIGGRRERRFRREDLEAFLAGTLAPGRASAAARAAARHWCGVYTSDSSRVRAAAAFLTPALQPDARCVLAAPPEVQRAVIAQVERDRPAIRRDLEAGRLVLAEYRDSPAAQLEYWRAQVEAARAAGARVTVVGDVSGGPLGHLPSPEVVEYETEYGRSISQRFGVATLCLYDAGRLSGVQVAAVLQCHDGHFQ